MKIKFDKTTTDKKFLLCVSGGADSMVMLHLFCRQLPTTQFSVVTVNHNLRKEGTDDADFVADFCQKKSVQCFKISVDVKSFAKQHKLSLETAARNLRYEKILQVLDDGGFDFACLAHHADDNAETVLLHLLRGGGINGASGIKQVYGRFFRPMLNFSKQQILEYANKESVPFVVDATNFKSDCNRNLLRNDVFPLLKQINPQFSKKLNDFAAICAQDNTFLEQLANIDSVKFEKDKATAQRSLFLQPKPVAVRVVYKIMRKLGVFKDIEYSHCAAILKLAQSNSGTKELSLPFDFVAVRAYEEIIIKKKSVPTKSQLKIPFCLGEINLDGVRFVVSSVDGFDKNDKKRHATTQNNLKQTLYLNADKIPSTAVFRFREDGDIFCKFGGGTKKLKEFFIDKKISKADRDQIPLLCDGKTVLAVLGVEICQTVKVEEVSQVIAVRML